MKTTIVLMLASTLLIATFAAQPAAASSASDCTNQSICVGCPGDTSNGSVCVLSRGDCTDGSICVLNGPGTNCSNGSICVLQYYQMAAAAVGDLTVYSSGSTDKAQAFISLSKTQSGSWLYNQFLVTGNDATGDLLVTHWRTYTSNDASFEEDGNTIFITAHEQPLGGGASETTRLDFLAGGIDFSQSFTDAEGAQTWSASGFLVHPDASYSPVHPDVDVSNDLVP